jgi:hypothetical protein
VLISIHICLFDIVLVFTTLRELEEAHFNDCSALRNVHLDRLVCLHTLSLRGCEEMESLRVTGPYLRHVLLGRVS